MFAVAEVFQPFLNILHGHSEYSHLFFGHCTDKRIGLFNGGFHISDQ
jgi:hypothetical protein